MKPALGSIVLLSALVGWLQFDPHSSVLAADVSVGIEGHYRVGRWTGVRVTGSDQYVATIETRDGDGVQVIYNHGDTGRWRYAIPGSEAAPLILRGPEELIASTRFPTVGSPSRGPAMIPLGTPWIVVFGDPLEVDQIGANELLGRDALLAVSMPPSSAEVPDSVLGYDGVDMMMIGGPAADLLQTLSDDQQQAIAQWITGGGWLFLTLGESTERLMQAAPWLLELLPVDSLTTTSIDPSALETFTASQTPLSPFMGARLPKLTGRILIQGRTARRDITPLAAEYNVGFGRITVVAADLDDAMFADWPDRMQLLTQLTGTILIPNLDQQVLKTRATAYNDLAGQLRATLDQFAAKRSYGFSIVSLILMALIAAIGPLDYLLINRVFGRPLLGWLTFPLAAIGLSVLLIYQARPVAQTQNTTPVTTQNATAGTTQNATPVTTQNTRPATNSESVSQASDLQCNRLEVFDFDALQQVGRGFVASYLYAHDANRFDLDVELSQSFAKAIDGQSRVLATPFGFPGESFGGIQIAIEDGRLPIYEVPFDQRGSKLVGVPLASRSSKGVSALCQFRPKPMSTSLQHRPGSELLQGELENPLPVDVLDGMLVYRNWAYILPTRFPVRGRIASIDLLRQKNFRWQLSRQQTLDNATETEAWDTSRNDAPMRVAEMLLFHDAAGGIRYTSLRHDPLAFLDLSHALSDDRCILVGRVADPLTTISTRKASADGSMPAQQPSGQRLSLVRVVLPVRDAD